MSPIVTQNALRPHPVLWETPLHTASPGAVARTMSPSSSGLNPAQGGHGAPCTSPFGAPGPFPVPAQLLRALQAAQCPCQTLPWHPAALRQLGWLHSPLCFGSGRAGRGNSSRSHPGAAGSCILGKRWNKPQQPSKRAELGEFSCSCVCVSPCWGEHWGATAPVEHSAA